MASSAPPQGGRPAALGPTDEPPNASLARYSTQGRNLVKCASLDDIELTAVPHLSATIGGDDDSVPSILTVDALATCLLKWPDHAVGVSMLLYMPVMLSQIPGTAITKGPWLPQMLDNISFLTDLFGLQAYVIQLKPTPLQYFIGHTVLLHLQCSLKSALSYSLSNCLMGSIHSACSFNCQKHKIELFKNAVSLFQSTWSTALLFSEACKLKWQWQVVAVSCECYKCRKYFYGLSSKSLGHLLCQYVQVQHLLLQDYRQTWYGGCTQSLASTDGPVSPFQLCCGQILAYHHLCNAPGQNERKSRVTGQHNVTTPVRR